MRARIEPEPTDLSAMNDGAVHFRVIHGQFRPRVLRYLKRLVGEHDAEDLTQLVMMKVSDGLARFRGDAQLATWIYRIATNTALDTLRGAAARTGLRSRPRGEPAAELEDAEEADRSAQASIPSTEATAIRIEMNECIRSFVDRLPDSYRAVIVLSELEGFKNREIAEILGVSVDAVKIRLHRAREKLKQELTAGCNFSRDEPDGFACDRKRTPSSPV